MTTQVPNIRAELLKKVVSDLLGPAGGEEEVITEQTVREGYGFHETAQGVRSTVSEAARREVLSRLLGLNHERWEEEIRNQELGIGDSGKKKVKKPKSKSTDGQMGLL